MHFRWNHVLYSLLVALAVVGCAGSTRSPTVAPTSQGEAATVNIHELAITTGQTIYVPAYAEVPYDNAGKTIPLAVTLIIHNTDIEKPIIVTSVRYYNAQGQLVREYVPEPQRLAALASADFFVNADEQNGGVGTNFVVEWVAEEAVYEPVVEALMLSTTGTQGISFTSPGRVISQREWQEMR